MQLPGIMAQSQQPNSVTPMQQAGVQAQQQNLINQLKASAQSHPIFQSQQRMLQAVEYILSNPSIPMSLKNNFYVLYENVIFGNYDDFDRKMLMSKFREWCILLKWAIPEQQWGNKQVFPDDAGEFERKIDLPVLLNELYQLYYIQLTRGKGGFTIKELGTQRTFLQTDDPSTVAPKGLRLF